MKKVHEEAEAALKKTQEEMKRYADRGRKEAEVWKKGDRALLSTKDLQRKTKQEVDREVCGALYNRRGSIVKHGKITIAEFDENPSGSKCELDSKI